MLKTLDQTFPYICVIVEDGDKEDDSSGATDLVTIKDYLSRRVDIARFDEEKPMTLATFHQEEGGELMVPYGEIEMKVFYAKAEGCYGLDLETGKRI